MKHGLSFVWVIVPALAFSACRNPVETLTTCVPGVGIGIIADVRDATTNADISQGAWGRAVEDTYRDTLVARGGYLHSTEARPGVYRVTIGRPGYYAWESSGVQVGSGACGVTSSTTLHVLLQRE